MIRASYLALLVLLAGCSTAGSPSSAAGPSATPSLEGSGKLVFSQASYGCTAGGTVWSFKAYLKERAGSLKVNLVLAKVDAAGGETQVNTTELAMSSPDNTSFTDGPLDVVLFCGDPFGVGDYVARITTQDGSKVLAEGNFTIAP